MKRFGLIIIGLIIIQAANAQAYKNVNATTFSELVQTGNGLLLDVRTKGEYSRGHIKGSTLISVADKNVLDKINMLQKDKPVYVYCLTGSRSNAVANYMSQNGFSEVYNLQRGIVEWHQLGYPIAQSSVVAKSESKIYTSSSFNQVLQSNKMVLVNFHAPWCAPCKKMAPDIEKVKADFTGKVLVEKVDVDANKNLQTANNIQSIPGIILYKGGEEVWRHTGVLSYDELSQKLNQYL